MSGSVRKQEVGMAAEWTSTEVGCTGIECAEEAPEAPQPPKTPDAPRQEEAEESRGGTATKTAPSKPRPRIDQLPPYRVLLHNDDKNDMIYVVETIMELTPLQKTRAVEAMLEAHTGGVSLLLVTHQERAELYRDQFRSKRLMVSIEPAV